ncbi:glycoside hydrolase family 28 protein [Rheinheimera texasensis]|uniref:glycoside hydrolase family 28 protein n=1 Tax=Rheinheimera texasensis TaxID=306205 RepID=UPI00068E4433|nr:glycosyl hydrolase family 28 protein [Rheinheimera texasensis]
MLTRRIFLQSALAAAAAAPLLAKAGAEPQSRLAQFEQLYLQLAKHNNRPALPAGKRVLVKSLGVATDGSSKITATLQQAIDALAAAGGGTLQFGEGQYLSGALQLKSGVQLEFDEGAVLLGSVDIVDYYDAQGQLHALLWADQASNIALCGKGRVDGQGRQLANNISDLHHSGRRIEPDFNLWRNRSNHRPQVIAFTHCENIRIYDLTIANSAAWVQHYGACTDLVIDGIRVDSDCYWNNDGIDINDCRKVRVSNCFINAADDAICLKSTKGLYNEDIEIRDCVVRSSANGVKFGTESQGGFRRVSIRNIVVFDTYRAAVALESVDGAFLEDVEVDGIDAQHVGCALFIRLGQRNMGVAPDKAVGTLRNVRIRNLKASIAFGPADLAYQVRGPLLNALHNPIPASITGLPDAKVHDVAMENIDISYPGRANSGMAYRPWHQLHLVPQERAAYPEYSMFGELPAYGLFVRHVDGLQLKNIQIRCRDADFRPALVLDDVRRLSLQQAHFAGTQRPQLVLQNVPQPLLLALSSDNQSGVAELLSADNGGIALVKPLAPYFETAAGPDKNATLQFVPAAKEKKS